jgi:hypothetical protein
MWNQLKSRLLAACALLRLRSRHGFKAYPVSHFYPPKVLKWIGRRVESVFDIVGWTGLKKEGVIEGSLEIATLKEPPSVTIGR